MWGVIVLKKIVIIILVLAAGIFVLPSGFGLWNETILVFGKVTIAQPSCETVALSPESGDTDAQGEALAPQEPQFPENEACVTSGASAEDADSSQFDTDTATSDAPMQDSDASDMNSDISKDVQEENTDEKQVQPSDGETAGVVDVSADDSAPCETNMQPQTQSDAGAVQDASADTND